MDTTQYKCAYVDISEKMYVQYGKVPTFQVMVNGVIVATAATLKEIIALANIAFVVAEAAAGDARWTKHSMYYRDLVERQ